MKRQRMFLLSSSLGLGPTLLLLLLFSSIGWSKYCNSIGECDETEDVAEIPEELREFSLELDPRAYSSWTSVPSFKIDELSTNLGLPFDPFVAPHPVKLDSDMVSKHPLTVKVRSWKAFEEWTDELISQSGV